MDELALRVNRLPLRWRYAVALLIVLSALVVRLLVLPLSAGAAYLTFTPAVVLAFYLCGSRGGWLAVAASVPLAHGFFLQQHVAERGWNPVLLGSVVFLVSAYIVAAVVAAQRRQAVQLAASLLAVERSKAELDEQMVFVRKVADALPYGIAYTAADGRYSFTNASFAHAAGRQPQQILRQTASQVHGSAAAATWVAMTNAGLKGEASAVTLATHADGRLRRLQVQVRPDVGADATVLGCFTTTTDVTERHALEAGLKDSEALLQRMGRVARIGGWAFELDSGRVTWTSETYRIHEVDPDFVPDLASAMTFYEPQAHALLQAAIARSLQDGTPYDLELGLITAKGRHTWVRSVGEAEFVDGRALRLVGAFQDIDEQHRLKLLAAENQRFLRQVMDHTPALIAHRNRDGRYTLVNRGYAEWLPDDDLRADAMLGRTAADLHGAQAQERMQPWFERALQGETVTFEQTLQRRGEPRELQITLVPDYDHQGCVQGLFSLKTDVTELRQTERRLRLVLDNVPALIGQIDAPRDATGQPSTELAQARYSLVNAAYARWLGLAADQVTSRSMVDVHGPAHPLLQTWLEEAFSGYSTQFEAELPQGDDTRAMQISYVPEFDAAGRVERVLTFATDITAIRRTEEQLRLVMHTTPLAIVLRHVDGRFIYGNPAWQRMHGQQRIERTGPSSSIIHPDDRPLMVEKWAQAVREGSTGFFDFRYQWPDGRSVWVRGHQNVIYRGGKPEIMVSMAQDIDAQVRAGQELAAKTDALARSNEDLERFAYVASHDLQEPLRMVNSYGQLLLRRHTAQLNEEAQAFVGYMVDGGTRAQALVRDLMALARLDSQAQPHASVDLDSVLQTVLQQLCDVIQSSAASISHEPLPKVRGDAVQLAQLLANLIGNGIKFRGKNPPQLQLRARLKDGLWHLSVQDNGIGIEPRFFDRVFVIFQRLHLRTEYDGTGIGLAICRRVVERHGGRIWIESQPDVSPGTTFHFTLDPASGSTAAAGSAAALA